MSLVEHNKLMSRRRAGVLCHITSLPNNLEFGDIGSDAFRFIDFLSSCGFTVWQVLPLGPTHQDLCPYQSLSSHAGNPQLINLEWLCKKGWLKNGNYCSKRTTSDNYKLNCIQAAYEIFSREANQEEMHMFLTFTKKQNYWLEKYALYMALREKFNYEPWTRWPELYRSCDTGILQSFYKNHKAIVDSIRFQQFIFFTQWAELKSYANSKGILIIGDLPIFVAHESADVWANHEYFSLNEMGETEFVAGVPPDYFSETGQRWGNPHYRWDKIVENGFCWWLDRIKTQQKLYDAIRIDHFRGLASYWEIPVNENTAINGRWVGAPGKQLLQAISQTFPNLTLIAEDLGTITPDVLELRDEFSIPGMLVMQFAFDGSQNNPYLPKNHSSNSLVYTATHDNDTTLAWYESLSEETKNYIWFCINHKNEPLPWPIIRTALESIATIAIIPMQDILSLGQGNRMNTPGTIDGNWKWKFTWNQIDPSLSNNIFCLLKQYSRNVETGVENYSSTHTMQPVSNL